MTATNTSEAGYAQGNAGRPGTRTDRWVAFLFGAASATMFLDFEISASGVRIRIFDIILIFLLAAYIASLLVTRRPTRIGGTDFLAVYLAYVAYCAANALLLASFKTMIVETAQGLSFALFFWLLTDMMRDKQRASAFFAGFIIGIWAISIYNSAYYLFRGQLFGFKDTGPQKLAHAYSLVATAMLLGHSKSKNRLMMVGLVAVAAILTLMSGERKGWIAAA